MESQTGNILIRKKHGSTKPCFSFTPCLNYIMHSPKDTIIPQRIQSFPKGFNYSPKDVIILQRIQSFSKEYNYSIGTYNDYE